MRPAWSWAVRALLCSFFLVGGAAPAGAAELDVPPLLWSLSAPSDARLAGASGVDYAGGLVYLTSYSTTGGNSSLSIVDPVKEEVIGSVSDPRLDGASALSVVGSYAYVTGLQNTSGLTNANRLTVVDVKDPTAPSVVASLQDGVALYGAYGVQVVGSLAYVAAQGCVESVCSNSALGNRLAVVDVSDKANPGLVGSVGDPLAATKHLDAIAVAGNRAYGTAFKSSTLTVFDVTNSAHPAILGSVSGPLLAGAADVVARGRYAYVIDQSAANARLVVVDVSDPVHPTIVGSALDTTNLDEGYWLALVGSHVFVAAAGSNALTVVDVSDPLHPQVVATRSESSTLGVADGIDVGGDTAYVAAFCTALTGCGSPTTGALTALDVTPYTGIDFTAGPLADDRSNRPNISFKSSQPGESLTCSLDGAPATACASPFVPASPLASGPHSLTVASLAGAATWWWTLDAPTISSPASGSSSTDTTPVFQGKAGTLPGDIDSVTIAVFPGEGVAGSPLQTLPAASDPTSGAYSVTASGALAPGTYTAQATQDDAAGGSASSPPVTFTVASLPPSEGGGGPGPGAEGGGGPGPGAGGGNESHPPSITISRVAYAARRASITVACSGPRGTKCQGTLRLSLREGTRWMAMGRARYSVGAGARRAIRVAVTPAARRAIARASGRLRVKVRATLTGGSVVTRLLKLRRSPAR